MAYVNAPNHRLHTKSDEARLETGPTSALDPNAAAMTDAIPDFGVDRDGLLIVFASVWLVWEDCV